MYRLATLNPVVLLLVVVGCHGQASSLPNRLAVILMECDCLELISLEHGKPEEQNQQTCKKEEFHSATILGKTLINEPARRQEIIAALERGAKERGRQWNCFSPRHGLRATTSNGEAVDVEICFE